MDDIVRRAIADYMKRTMQENEEGVLEISKGIFLIIRPNTVAEKIDEYNYTERTIGWSVMLNVRGEPIPIYGTDEISYNRSADEVISKSIEILSHYI